jgi:alkanesulfonate monooxygenase SsuD/methylene tetrahydromethanopterin reductase-like flavin-dependent oxidoreductase (luciferase family)
MAKVGYFLSSEEFGPNEFIEQAKMAQKAGFEALWTSEQGNPSFVWSVIGASPKRPLFP